MKTTQPLSTCCKAPIYFETVYPKLGLMNICMCLKCKEECSYYIATSSQTIKAQQVSGTSVNVSSSKNIHSQNIATPEKKGSDPLKETEGMNEEEICEFFKRRMNDITEKYLKKMRERATPEQPKQQSSYPLQLDTPDTDEWLEKEIDDYECRGMSCRHEMTAKHYIFDIDSLRQLIRTEKLKVVEDVKSAQPDMPDEVFAIVDDYDDYITGFNDCKLKTLNAINKKLLKSL